VTEVEEQDKEYDVECTLDSDEYENVGYLIYKIRYGSSNVNPQKSKA